MDHEFGSPFEVRPSFLLSWATVALTVFLAMPDAVGQSIAAFPAPAGMSERAASRFTQLTPAEQWVVARTPSISVKLLEQERMPSRIDWQKHVSQPDVRERLRSVADPRSDLAQIVTHSSDRALSRTPAASRMRATLARAEARPSNGPSDRSAVTLARFAVAEHGSGLARQARTGESALPSNAKAQSSLVSRGVATAQQRMTTRIRAAFPLKGAQSGSSPSDSKAPTNRPGAPPTQPVSHPPTAVTGHSDLGEWAQDAFEDANGRTAKNGMESYFGQQGRDFADGMGFDGQRWEDAFKDLGSGLYDLHEFATGEYDGLGELAEGYQGAMEALSGGIMGLLDALFAEINALIKDLMSDVAAIRAGQDASADVSKLLDEALSNADKKIGDVANRVRSDIDSARRRIQDQEAVREEVERQNRENEASTMASIGRMWNDIAGRVKPAQSERAVEPDDGLTCDVQWMMADGWRITTGVSRKTAEGFMAHSHAICGGRCECIKILRTYQAKPDVNIGDRAIANPANC